MKGRFKKGLSGNPSGRPRKRQAPSSALDVILEKRLSVSQNGIERDLTIDEALEWQTYQAALKGSMMAVRSVLKMIEKREFAIRKAHPEQASNVKVLVEHDSDNAEEALVLLGITQEVAGTGRHHSWQRKFVTWAVQAGLSRPGKRELSKESINYIKQHSADPAKLKWPRSAAR